MYRSLWIDDEVAALRDMARKFFDTEGAPNRERWEQQQHVDREFWLKAAKWVLEGCRGSAVDPLPDV